MTALLRNELKCKSSFIKNPPLSQSSQIKYGT